MLDVIADHRDLGPVPFIHINSFLGTLIRRVKAAVRGDQIVQRRQGTIAVRARLGIRMKIIVQDLKLTADGRGADELAVLTVLRARLCWPRA